MQPNRNRSFTPLVSKYYTIFILAVWMPLLASCGGTDPQGEKPPASSSVVIENKGSDTIVNLALAWAERYQEIRPELSVSVTGGGSGTGIASLINGTTDIANASREIKPEEIELARANGEDPVEFIIARDAIAVIVNPENPIQELTLQEISGIFGGEINNWQELGGEDRPIVRVSRETNSGTHVYFLEEVLRLGNADNQTLFARDTLLLPSSEGIIAEVSTNPNAIGYDGLGYVTSEVKVLGISPSAGDPYVMPSVNTVVEGRYPISRNLYMYTAHQPDGEVKNYLDWILSPDAQELVSELGFVPVNLN